MTGSSLSHQFGGHPHGSGNRQPRVAIMDVGLGMLATAAAVRRLRPDADLVLATDPDGMPWGVRSPEDLRGRALMVAESAFAYEPDLLIVACNTATLHALPAIKEYLEPRTRVVGTLPPVEAAAAAGGPLAVWGTATGIGSPQLRDLIEQFAAGLSVTQVACHGLSDAIERADSAALADAIATAVERTPVDVQAVALACTHYELVAPQIHAALQAAGRSAPVLHGSAAQLANQALVLLGLQPDPGVPTTGSLTVLRSGRTESLPQAAGAYLEGRVLQSFPAVDTGVA
ncbi:glutamate racemase [Streptomyces sp. NPDC088197]|uniref:glutamate racemase n=1 Tax=unclassified Streptomyces TaxID=2593676 RepID=UPI0033A263C8